MNVRISSPVFVTIICLLLWFMTPHPVSANEVKTGSRPILIDQINLAETIAGNIKQSLRGDERESVRQYLKESSRLLKQLEQNDTGANLADSTLTMVLSSMKRLDRKLTEFRSGLLDHYYAELEKGLPETGEQLDDDKGQKSDLETFFGAIQKATSKDPEPSVPISPESRDYSVARELRLLERHHDQIRFTLQLLSEESAFDPSTRQRIENHFRAVQSQLTYLAGPYLRGNERADVSISTYLWIIERTRHLINQSNQASQWGQDFQQLLKQHGKFLFNHPIQEIRETDRVQNLLQYLRNEIEELEQQYPQAQESPFFD